MSIVIYQLEIIDNETHENIHSLYFLTRRGAQRYGAKREKEWKKYGWTWTYGGEPLYFGRLRD